MDTDDRLKDFTRGLRALLAAEMFPFTFWDIVVVYESSHGEEAALTFGYVYFDYEAVLRAVAAARMVHPGFTVIRLRRWMMTANGNLEMDFSMEAT